MLLSLLGEHAVAGVVLQKCTNIFFLISFLLFIFFCRYLLKVGDHNLSKKEKSEQLMDLEKIYVHANYIHSKIVNDIALVKLKAGVKLGKFVRTVCLPQKQEGDVAVPLKYGIVVGWGSTKALKPGERPKDADRYANSLLYSVFPVQHDQLCAN